MLLPKLSARTRELKAVETTVINLTIMIPLERGGAIVAARPNGGESTGPFTLQIPTLKLTPTLRLTQLPTLRLTLTLPQPQPTLTPDQAGAGLAAAAAELHKSHECGACSEPLPGSAAALHARSRRLQRDAGRLSVASVRLALPC